MSWYPPFVEISFNVSRIRREEEYCYNCKDGLIRFHSRGSQFFFFPSKVSTGFAVEVEKLTDNKTRIWKCIAIDEHSRQFDLFAERFPFLLDSEGNWILSPLSYPFSRSFRKKKKKFQFDSNDFTIDRQAIFNQSRNIEFWRNNRTF